MTKDSNTRLRGVKEEPHDLKRDVNSSLTKFESSIETKFDGINVLKILTKTFRIMLVTHN